MTGDPAPPAPFREVVLKVHSRCDLACDHCYVYEHADQSWRTRPRTITDEALTWTARRLAEHVATHGLPSMTVILHGGEPLLAGPARLRRICAELTTALAPLTSLDLRIHTNGLQLGPRHLDVFDAFGVRVGVSLDGDRAANDRHRRFADGRSSHPLVLRAVELLHSERYRHLDLGLLCTIDLANDPVAVYDALTALDPPRIDFLLPHATWEHPPDRPGGGPPAPYADWILAAFDRWNSRGRPVPVRLFESVLSTLDGGPSLTESLGLAPTDLVVIETDGTLEQADSLKAAYDGAPATGFDVLRHSLDEVAAHPGIRARRLGLDGVSATCRRCPVVRSCGGGLYTHRHRTANGFDNPSVYCPDLESLVRGIEDRTAAALAAPAVTDPEALAAAQLDLTRVLLARLNSELTERGDDGWSGLWELAGTIERLRPEALDEILAHPYTRAFLLRCLDRRHEDDGSGLASTARQFARHLAAAAVRGGLDLPVPLFWPGRLLSLPTLGALRPLAPGRLELRATGDGGFLVRSEGGEQRVERPAERGHPGWFPARRLGGFVLDDHDGCRACYGVPVAGPLDGRRAADWTGRLGRALDLVRAATPDDPALTTVTPLTGTGPAASREAPGAVGVPFDGTPEQLARAFVRGRRRARLLALTGVTDLYALDGAWTHSGPWRGTPVPVSELLSETYERAGLAAYEPGHADGLRRALDLLDKAPELTVSGRLLVSELRKETEGEGRRP
ncbi:FxsB family radical SAM/SPASM domain protein [Streptomyces sp. MUM 203J]|uniref:radical SAM/SPASM protein FxsBH, inactivated beta-hydroxylase extension form n=1 Tax=Streptomyces sp. MUM 203J TaxID=2791990 RepID=UPI001F04AEB7|nr:radical SAM/SPASM protein FxsB, inactivated metallohydrolase extension form [Streptomyces sp. MUM 203J]MCH0539533.1 FxsB family radical SAM/SPASM domain protein [Streptomyces sp. MUM 203J]